ncbi:MAG: hypothetical protein A2X36_11265 [Elusimicrobia bacterium GWA2_69_24]|nr:MAG: hypothetical protein A2X36_11265 [Elusimicrobia bacterium GWA2_69_24]HBL18097.1 hypothetical protein [Elusimicrobiota bacterium]
MYPILTAAVLLLSLSVRTAFAAFEDMPATPRTSAQAGSTVAQGDDLAGMFLNPAALASMTQWQMYTTYEKLYVGLTDGSALGRQIVAIGAPTQWGAFAFAWDQFALAGLYTESAMGLSYARRSGQKLHWGFNLRNLAVKYGSDEYSSQNPVLKSGGSKSAMGLDLGMKYLAQSLTWGLAIANMNEPDLGIKHVNKVDRRIDLGVNSRMGSTDLNAGICRAGADTKFKFGVERLTARKTFAMRAGLNVGTRDYRNLAFGFGYNGRRFRFDYSMTMPLSGLSGTMGTHQLGLLFTWGRPVKMRAKPQKGAGAEDEEAKSLVRAKVQPPSVDERLKARQSLAQARKDILGGNYRGGLDRIKGADLGLASDEEIKDLQGLMAKAEVVASIYPRVDGNDEKARLVQTAIAAYMSGDKKTAVTAALYAYQRWPDDARILQLRDMINKAFPLEAFETKPLPGVTLPDQMLQEALELIYDGKYVSAINKCNEVLRLEPDNVMALTRTGSAYWAMGKEEEARQTWRRALKLEPGNDQLRKFLDRKSAEETRRIPKKVSEATEEEFRKSLAYYERLKRSGVEKATLQQILKKMIEQFEGTGIEMSHVYKEYELSFAN